MSAFVPPWAHDGGNEKMVERLKDPALRARIVKDIHTPSATWDNEWDEVPGPESILVGVVKNPALALLAGPDHCGHCEVPGQGPARHPARYSGRGQRLYAVAPCSACRKTMWRWRWCSPGSRSTTTARVPRRREIWARNIRIRALTATFPRILRKYVREEHRLTLPEAIRKFSALPAQRMRLTDRGVLKRGLWADVVVFDPATVADRSTFSAPNELAVGMRWVLVNGVPVIDDGKMTGAKPGHVLRGPGYKAPAAAVRGRHRCELPADLWREKPLNGRTVVARGYPARRVRCGVAERAQRYNGLFISRLYSPQRAEAAAQRH